MRNRRELLKFFGIGVAVPVAAALPVLEPATAAVVPPAMSVPRSATINMRVQVNAFDSQCVERWLRNGGARMIEQVMRTNRTMRPRF